MAKANTVIMDKKNNGDVESIKCCTTGKAIPINTSKPNIVFPICPINHELTRLI